MSKKKLHPAVESAAKASKTKYVTFAISIIICAVLITLGFFIKPKPELRHADSLTKDTEVDTYVKDEIVLVSAMFSQDKLDENGKVIGENYHILAVDSEDNKFIITAPREFYESKLAQLETNLVQDIESGQFEVLNNEQKVEVFGYTRNYSSNLKAQLNNYLSGYESVLLKNTLEVVETPETINKINYFFVAGGVVGAVSFILLIYSVSSSVQLSKTKKKYAQE